MNLRAGSALLALSLFTGCDRSCIDVFCASFASASFALSDGSRLPVESLRVDVDERTVTCQPSVDPDLFTCDDPLLGFALREDADCTERVSGEAVSLDCVPNGRLAWVADILGTPRSVVFRLQGPGSPQTVRWQPEYASTLEKRSAAGNASKPSTASRCSPSEEGSSCSRRLVASNSVTQPNRIRRA